ncbi:MAG: hypothetical protein JWO98_5471, partial [Frankiales bacterium]|nr:hypothetical protein [Frankiales bacterium]
MQLPNQHTTEVKPPLPRVRIMNNITTRSTGLPDGVIALTATTWRI